MEKERDIDPTSAFVVCIRSKDDDDASSPLRITIRNATQDPLYYIRHYGPRNDNRVDSQLTYMWYASFPKDHNEIDWQLDGEVADHKWMSLDDAAEWLLNDAKTTDNDSEGVRNTGEGLLGGVGNDGPDRGDFCHMTIRSLYAVGLRNILQEMSI